MTNEMKVEDPTLVIVRGINHESFRDNLGHFCISFGGIPQAIPKNNAYYVGLYLDTPNSAITHIGIVEYIERGKDYADFHLKSLIKLNSPKGEGKGIRKHEYWHLKDFDIKQEDIEKIRDIILNTKI